MEDLPTFALKITQFCRQIYHTWSIWAFLTPWPLRKMLQVFWLDAERSFSAQRLLEMQLGGRSGEPTLWAPNMGEFVGILVVIEWL